MALQYADVPLHYIADVTSPGVKREDSRIITVYLDYLLAEISNVRPTDKQSDRHRTDRHQWRNNRPIMRSAIHASRAKKLKKN